MEKLEGLCLPLVEYLKEKYDPYTEITVTMNSITVRQDVEGIPVERKSD